MLKLDSERSKQVQKRFQEVFLEFFEVYEEKKKQWKELETYLSDLK